MSAISWGAARSRGPEKDQRGSLLEISWNGTEPVELRRRREADVPGRRRFAGDARLVPGRRLPRRLWRGRGHDLGGGVILSVIAGAQATAIHRPARIWIASRYARSAMTRTVHRSCGGISRSRAQCAATSSRLYFRCTRLSDGGCFVDAHARPPLVRGPDRPRHKAAAAVRADIVQLVLDAIRAERAFIGADPRVHRIRRQVLVAIFAVRPELQRHGRLVSDSRIDRRRDAFARSRSDGMRMTNFPRFEPHAIR